MFCYVVMHLLANANKLKNIKTTLKSISFNNYH